MLLLFGNISMMMVTGLIGCTWPVLGTAEYLKMSLDQHGIRTTMKMRIYTVDCFLFLTLLMFLDLGEPSLAAELVTSPNEASFP